MSTERKLARQLRLAVVTLCVRQNLISELDAMELLAGRLSPDDDLSIVDDSLLLDDPFAIQTISDEYKVENIEEIEK